VHHYRGRVRRRRAAGHLAEELDSVSVPASYPIESVGTAAQVLLMLRDKPSLRVAGVAQELGVARSTAHRMLTTLQEAGLLRQDEASKEYRAGPALVQLGIAVIGATDLRAEAKAALELLASVTGETAHLLTLEGTETVFLDGVEGRHVIRAALRIGQRGPAHASAAGKALLAFLPPEELRARYPSSRLRGGTDRAPRTVRELEDALEQVRRQGYATNFSESEPDLTAVAAAIPDGGAVARFALSVSGPAQRLGSDVSAIVAQVRRQADLLGGRSG
jgi:IclR family transcriptional regulator, acetate operon repressor